MIKENKKRLRFLIVLSLVVTLGIGVTLALLKDITETKKNTFSSNKKIALLLREPSWDGYEFADKSTTNGQSAKPGLTEEERNKLGVEKAARYVPGENIPKNPQVKNNGDAHSGIPVYAAIKVQFMDETDTQVTYQQFMSRYLDSAGISFDTAHWEEIETQNADKLFIYRDILQPGEDTAEHPLFTEVPISLELSPDGKTGLLPGFNITITAYAIQSDYVEDPKGEMLKFVSGITE